MATAPAVGALSPCAHGRLGVGAPAASAGPSAASLLLWFRRVRVFAELVRGSFAGRLGLSSGVPDARPFCFTACTQCYSFSSPLQGTKGARELPGIQFLRLQLQAGLVLGGTSAWCAQWQARCFHCSQHQQLQSLPHPGPRATCRWGGSLRLAFSCSLILGGPLRG